MPLYLLDTNIVGTLVRDPAGLVAGRLAALTDGDYATSIVVAAELRFGAARRNAIQLTVAIDGILARIPVLALDAPFDRVYGELRADLERKGLALSANDLLIAAHALALDCVLVTADRAFARVEGLAVENWLA